MRKHAAAPFSTSKRLLLLVLLFLFGRRPLPLLEGRPRLLVLARPARPPSRLLFFLLFRRRLLLGGDLLPLKRIEGVRAGLRRRVPFFGEVRTVISQMGPVALVTFWGQGVVAIGGEGVLALLVGSQLPQEVLWGIISAPTDPATLHRFSELRRRQATEFIIYSIFKGLSRTPFSPLLRRLLDRFPRWALRGLVGPRRRGLDAHPGNFFRADLLVGRRFSSSGFLPRRRARAPLDVVRRLRGRRLLFGRLGLGRRRSFFRWFLVQFLGGPPFLGREGALLGRARRRRPPATVIHRLGDVLRVDALLAPTEDVLDGVGEARRTLLASVAHGALIH